MERKFPEVGRRNGCESIVEKLRKGFDIFKVRNKFEPLEDFDGSQGDNAFLKH